MRNEETELSVLEAEWEEAGKTRMTSGLWTYTENETGITVEEYADRTVTELTIPDTIDGKPVTEIGAYAFAEYNQLTTVSLPDGLREIGGEAFRDCKLKAITIPDSVALMGPSVFSNCVELESVTLSKSLGTISGYAFAHCSRLEKVEIPDAVIRIGYKSFADCERLTEVVLPKYAKDEEFFWDGCPFTHTPYEATWAANQNLGGISVQIEDLLCRVEDDDETVTILGIDVSGPNSHTPIPTEVYGRKVTTIMAPYSNFGWNTYDVEKLEIPEGITTIGPGGFSQCPNLKQVIIPDSVTEIEGGAFSYCPSLKEVSLPKNVKVAETAFEDTPYGAMRISDGNIAGLGDTGLVR